MTENDETLQELRDETQRGNRLDEDSPTDHPTFVDEIVGALDEVEAGERAKTLSFYDPRMAAVFAALDARPSRQAELVTALQEYLDRPVDTSDIDRTQVLRLAVRAGIEAADPDLLADAKTASSERAEREF